MTCVFSRRNWNTRISIDVDERFLLPSVKRPQLEKTNSTKVIPAHSALIRSCTEGASRASAVPKTVADMIEVAIKPSTTLNVQGLQYLSCECRFNGNMRPGKKFDENPTVRNFAAELLQPKIQIQYGGCFRLDVWKFWILMIYLSLQS